MVSIVGRVATSTFENADGDNVYLTEIVADRVQFLEPPGSEKRKSQDQEPIFS